MWSRKPTPVAALPSPPSRSRASLICVSAVLRSFVAVRLHLEAEASVPRQQVEHVVEEPDTGLRARLSPVEVEREPDPGLGGLALLF